MLNKQTLTGKLMVGYSISLSAWISSDVVPRLLLTNRIVAEEMRKHIQIRTYNQYKGL